MEIPADLSRISPHWRRSLARLDARTEAPHTFHAYINSSPSLAGMSLRRRVVKINVLHGNRGPWTSRHRTVEATPYVMRPSGSRGLRNLPECITTWAPR